ncbi:uncharacterized protein LOC143276732 [Babylonia areolata]|uniref:uncharacterized protein LOC143276732 n=1 Tax=Babylonia areolata TaxID=304850 RepID=UPI003FD1A2F3
MSFREEASQFFDEADVDNEGHLSKLELAKVCQKSGCQASLEEIADWFMELDENDDGKVSKQEFLDALDKLDPEEVTEADLMSAFKKLDADGSGYITREELQQVVQSMGQDTENIELDMDDNGDGKVSYEEFLKIFRSKRKS